MSNKAWDLISYQQSAEASRREKVKRMAIYDEAYSVAEEVKAAYMKQKCPGYGVRCDVDCDVWACPHSTLNIRMDEANLRY